MSFYYEHITGTTKKAQKRPWPEAKRHDASCGCIAPAISAAFCGMSCRDTLSEIGKSNFFVTLSCVFPESSTARLLESRIAVCGWIPEFAAQLWKDVGAN